MKGKEDKRARLPYHPTPYVPVAARSIIVATTADGGAFSFISPSASKPLPSGMYRRAAKALSQTRTKTRPHPLFPNLSKLPQHRFRLLSLCFSPLPITRVLSRGRSCIHTRSQTTKRKNLPPSKFQKERDQSIPLSVRSDFNITLKTNGEGILRNNPPISPHSRQH